MSDEPPTPRTDEKALKALLPIGLFLLVYGIVNLVSGEVSLLSSRSRHERRTGDTHERHLRSLAVTLRDSPALHVAIEGGLLLVGGALTVVGGRAAASEMRAR